MAPDPPHNILKTQRSRLAGQFTPASQQHQGRDTGNAEPDGQRLLFFCIYFCQPNLRLQHLRRLLIGRGHHSAGPAPGGPEIDQQGNFRSLGVEIEIRRREGDRMPRKQCPMTLTAARLLRQTSRRHSIDTSALRADQVNHVTHSKTCVRHDAAPLPITPFPFTAAAPAAHPSMAHAARPHSPTVAMSFREGPFVLNQRPDVLVRQLVCKSDHTRAG